MDARNFPTKGNLILAQNSLALSKQGFDLMDKKRNVLIQEVSALIKEATIIQDEINATFEQAYLRLQEANIDQGIYSVEELSYTVPIENSITIKTRSVMGTDIPLVQKKDENNMPSFSFSSTKESVDKATIAFRKVKDLTIRLSQIENAAYRLADNIRKSQKRANALKNITIPKYESLVKSITESLEEKEREEFSRLKVIKKRLN